jgi:hypothetical protein
MAENDSGAKHGTVGSEAVLKLSGDSGAATTAGIPVNELPASTILPVEPTFRLI